MTAFPGNPPGCDSPAPATVRESWDGTTQCLCLVCARCGRHAANSHQGHYAAICVFQPMQKGWHCCCPGDCELAP